MVGAARPVRRRHHPDHGRQAEGDRDPEVGDSELAADRRHQRLHRRIARRRRPASPRKAGRIARGRGWRQGPSGGKSRKCSVSSRIRPKSGRGPPRPCHRCVDLPTHLADQDYGSHHDLSRRTGSTIPRLCAPRRRGRPLWHFLKGLRQASGDGRIGHPVLEDADRQDARAGRLGELQIVRRIRPRASAPSPSRCSRSWRPTRPC